MKEFKNKFRIVKNEVNLDRYYRDKEYKKTTELFLRREQFI